MYLYKSSRTSPHVVYYWGISITQRNDRCRYCDLNTLHVPEKQQRNQQRFKSHSSATTHPKRKNPETFSPNISMSPIANTYSYINDYLKLSKLSPRSSVSYPTTSTTTYTAKIKEATNINISINISKVNQHRSLRHLTK